MPGLKQVDKAAVLAHIREHQPCNLTCVQETVLGRTALYPHKPRKGIITALHEMERAGLIKVTPFKHGLHTRHRYEVAP